MKHLKSGLALVLSAALCVGLMAIPAQAAEPDSTKEFRNGKTSAVGCAYASATLVLQADGSLWGWGRSDLGALGNGDSFDKDVSTASEIAHFRTYPEKIMTDVQSLVTDNSSSISLVIKNDGSLWYTGAGTGYDTLGFYITKRDFQTTFTKLMDNVVSADVDFFDNSDVIYAVDGNGVLWQFSFESILVSGTGTVVIGEDPTPSSYRYEIKKEKVMDSVQKVSAGKGFCLALKTDGSVWGWGATDEGQLGNAAQTTDVDGNIPATNSVKILDGVKDVYTGYAFSGAIQQDGSLWMWGKLPSGIQTKPLKKTDSVKKVSSTIWGQDIAILKEDGALYMWGKTTLSSEWTGVTDTANMVKTTINDVVEVSVGGQILFVTSNGSLYVWGHDYDGMYGAEYQPVQLSGFTNTPPIQSIGFTDVASGAYYEDAVKWAVDKKITSGTTATTFAPGATCTDAQIITFLWRANGEPKSTIANPFGNVKESDYFYQAALWAHEKGLVSGNVFTSTTPCTRSQTVLYLWKLAGSPEQAPISGLTDVDGGADYAKAVAWAVEQGITAGTSKTTFSPDTTCTRGQIVTFLFRAMGK